MAPLSTTAASPSLLSRLTATDAAISCRLHSISHTVLPRAVLILLEYSADFRLFFPIAIAVLLSAPRSSPLQRSFGASFIVGLILDLVFVGLVKIIFRRSRPAYNKEMNVAVSADHYSFPSGHASRVCFVAAFIFHSAAMLREAFEQFDSIDFDFVGTKFVEYFISVVWVWAVVTSVSRVLLGRHFVSDVFAGACLGVLEGLFVFHFVRF